jgi:hypothetical protein
MATFKEDFETRICRVIDHIPGSKGPSSLLSPEREFMAEPTQMTAEVFWTLVGFIEYLGLQRWVEDVVETRLMGPGESVRGIQQQGIVPGLSDWEYWFHGIGCRFTNRIDGRQIDVDWHGGGVEYVDDFFFMGYLQSLSQPGPIEARLLQAIGRPEAVIDHLRALGDEGVLVRLANTNARTLADDDDDDLVQMVNEFIDLVKAPRDESDARRIAIAACEWDRVATDIPADEDGVTWRQAAEMARQASDRVRLERLERLWKLSGTASVLSRLCREDAARADLLIEEAFRQADLEVLEMVVEVVDKKNLERHHDAAFRCLKRLVAGDLPPLAQERKDRAMGLKPERAAAVWDQERAQHVSRCIGHLAGFLVRNGHQGEKVVQMLKPDDVRASVELALVVLEHRPEQARAVIRRLLRTGSPSEASQAAAILAILNEPWCVADLLDVLEESESRETSAEVRAAISASTDAAARAALEAWELKYPRNPDSEGQHVLDNDDRVLVQMQRLHDRVLPLRGRVPVARAGS